MMGLLKIDPWDLKQIHIKLDNIKSILSRLDTEPELEHDPVFDSDTPCVCNEHESGASDDGWVCPMHGRVF